MWLTRAKVGMGRASKNEWDILSEVNAEWFDHIEQHREWHFGFNDFYDIYVWDLQPGQPFGNLSVAVQEVYFALRPKIVDG